MQEMLSRLNSKGCHLWCEFLGLQLRSDIFIQPNGTVVQILEILSKVYAFKWCFSCRSQNWEKVSILFSHYVSDDDLKKRDSRGVDMFADTEDMFNENYSVSSVRLNEATLLFNLRSVLVYCFGNFFLTLRLHSLDLFNPWNMNIVYLHVL